MTGAQVQGNDNTVASDGGVVVRDNLGNIVTGGGSIIESLEVQYSAMREVAPLIDESLQDVESASFIIPSEVSSLSQKLAKEHIFILQGMARWGKSSLARYLALQLTKQDTNLKVKTMIDHSLLTDVLLNLKREKNTILILYNAKAVVFGREIDELRKLAQNQNNFLVLTTTNSPQVWKLTEAQQSALWWNVESQSPYTTENLIQILQNRTQDHNLNQVLTGNSIQNIASSLESPASILRFVELLDRTEGGIEIDQLVKQARNVEGEIIKWYDKLDKSSQYFLLALVLFNGLGREQFWAAYESLMREVWQKRDRNLLLAEDNTLQKMYDFVEETESQLRFKNSEYREIVLRHAIRSYRRALVQALPFLQDMVIKSVGSLNRASDNFASFELYGSSTEPYNQIAQKRRAIRITIAEAVSWIAKEEPKNVEVLLSEWAKNPSPEVRETACLTLLQNLRRGDGYTLQDMLNQLLIWYTRYKSDRVEDTPVNAYIRSTAGIGAGYLARLFGENTNDTSFSLDKYLEVVHSRDISIPSDVTPLELLAIVSSDANYRTRQGAAIGAGILSITDFDLAEPILRTLANDWTENVRLQVIQVLISLSLPHYEGVIQALNRWLTSSQPIWKRIWNQQNSQRWSSDKQVEAAQMTSKDARLIIEIDKDQLRGDYDQMLSMKGDGGPCYWTSTLALVLISSLHQDNEALVLYQNTFSTERNLDSRKQALGDVISYLINRGRNRGIDTFAGLCKTNGTGIVNSTLRETLKSYGKNNTETSERLIEAWKRHSNPEFEQPIQYLREGIIFTKKKETSIKILKGTGSVLGAIFMVLFWIIGLIMEGIASAAGGGRR